MPPGTPQKTQNPSNSGFSLLELLVAVAIMGVIAAAGAILMGDSFRNQRARSATRSVADLIHLGRSSAIRLRRNHLLFFDRDAQGNALTGPEGRPAAALLVRDDNGDGKVQAGERVAAVPLADAGGLSWGSSLAANASPAVPAPADNGDASFPATDPDFVCCTFLEPDADPARWVVFLPDGTPRAFSIDPFNVGLISSGNGSVYVTTSDRDYAVVLAPLGGVRMHGWRDQNGSWTP